ncbi:hypothetical protein [Melittangium boletus]|uniref:hypothetical protein n=1 Tax=Melittangium boletus TaxID=83453 RepID=UPI003DA3848B
MSSTFLSSSPLRWAGFSSLMVGAALGGAYLDRHFADAEWARRSAEYQRQLRGDLTAQEQRMQALNTELGLARSQLVSQGDLDRKYQAALQDKDKAFEAFRQEQALVLQSVSDARFQLQQRLQTGSEVAQASAPMASPPPVISYQYTDKEGRFSLRDPNIWVEGDERVDFHQSFRVEGTVLAQADGSLMTERVQLFEVAPQGDGQGPSRTLASARMVDAHFTYAHAPLREPSRANWRWGPGWSATVGTSFRPDSPLRAGVSANLVRWSAVGLSAGVSSDFRALQGSGGDLLLSYAPSLHGRALGVSLGGGVHLPLAGPRRVLPTFTLSFSLD